MKRALRIVLMRDRYAKGGHHRVADELLHRSAGTLDLGRHCLVEAIEHGARSLWILAVSRLRRANQIREEHRDELSLVADRWVLNDRSATSSAEACHCWQLCPTPAAAVHASL